LAPQYHFSIQSFVKRKTQNNKLMKNKEDKKNQLTKGLAIAMASAGVAMMTGCVAAVPVAVHPTAHVQHYPSTVHTSHAVHHRPVAVAPVAVRPVARAASPVGVGGTARRTSRRVTRRH
jgi:hypothetical protein